MKSIFRIAKSIAALALAICAAAPAVALTVTTTSGNGSISLAWTAEAGATAYRVEHATTSGGPYAELASGLAATTYTHTGVASGGTNYYVVTASTPGGDVASAEVMGRWVASRIRAINCGGPAVGDFAADHSYTTGSPVGTAAPIVTTGVVNPAPEAVYQTGRSNAAVNYNLGPFSLARPYQVRAHFAEIVYTGAVARANFHTYLNDVAASDAYWMWWMNLKKLAEGVNKAYVIEKEITPSTSGRIEFATQVSGIVNALEVYTFGAPIPNAMAYPRDGKALIDLSAVLDSQSVSIKRSLASGGPYTTIASEVTGASYVDAGLDNGTAYYYVVSASNAWGVVDSSELPVVPGVLAYAINVNGAALVGRFVPENNTFTRTGGDSVTVGLLNQSIPLGTPDPAESIEVYRYLRTGAQTYIFSSLQPGETYLMRLHFEEDTKTAVGARVFHVDVNGERKLAGLDLVALAGGKRFVGLVREFTAVADANGQFTVQFVAATDVPTVSAIEIRQQSGTMTPRSPTGLTASAQAYLVTLSWNRPNQENSYTVWRSTTAGGPYDVLASNIVSGVYIDATPANGVTYYYKVVGEVGGQPVAAAASGEASATSNYGSTQTGLHVQYYRDFAPGAVTERLAHSETLSTVDSDWGSGSIGSASVGDRNAKVVWNGTLALAANNTYTFHAKAKGGFRLWVAYNCVIDHWTEDGAGEWVSGTLAYAGVSGNQPIRAEFYNTQGDAEATLEWECAGIGLSRQVVSPVFLRPVALGDPGAWVFREVGMAFPGYGNAISGASGGLALFGAGAEGVERHQYACQRISGAFELVARIASYDTRGRYGATWNSRFGIVVRSGLLHNEGFAAGYILNRDESKTLFMSKADLAASGAFVEAGSVGSRKIPMYLKVRRELEGGLYAMRCSYSTDGENWTEDYVGTVGGTAREVYVGLGIGVKDTAVINVNFDSVSLKRLNAETLIVIR